MHNKFMQLKILYKNFTLELGAAVVVVLEKIN